MTKTFVIAEIGSNHDGNIDQAYELIKQCKYAGADAVKFQIYSANTLYSKNTPDFDKYTNVHSLIKNNELPRQWLATLQNYAEMIDIEFLATPFDEDAVDKLVHLGVKRLKIAAFESSDPRFVKYCARTKLPLIVSIGIGGDATKTLKWILEENPAVDITLLHANSAYPTPAEDINLGSIMKIRNDVCDVISGTYPSGIKFGFSDHTESTLTPALAVMLGATVIEKHVTLNKNFEGPDHAFAMEILQFKEMVDNIRFAEKCKGIAESITPSESTMVNAMRSVFAKCDIKAGEVLTEDNISTIRPYLENSIPAKNYYYIIGNICKYNYKAGELLNINEYTHS